ncbi:MAG: hypothetical protein AAF399_31120 [Bacteroidota bacterium]
MKSSAQTPLKIILAVQTIGLLIYTFFTIQRDGANFFGAALEFATSLTWMGQFSLDFACYLILSTLWIMWRGKYSWQSLVIGSLAGILGIIVFAPYVFWLLVQEKGDLVRVLIGDRGEE